MVYHDFKVGDRVVMLDKDNRIGRVVGIDGFSIRVRYPCKRPGSIIEFESDRPWKTLKHLED